MKGMIVLDLQAGLNCDIGNPLLSPLDKFMEKLNLYLGLIRMVNSQLNSYRELVADSFKKNNMDVSVLASGSALIISDLTEWPDHGWRINYSTGRLLARGEAYLNAVDMLIQREAAWSIMQGYEAFESFLYDLTAALLFIHGDRVDLKKLAGYKHAVKTQEEWRMFLRSRYRGRNNEEILTYIRTLEPQLIDAEKNNNRLIDLNDWYDAISEVRHAVVHANFVISKRNFQKLQLPQQKLLYSSFPGEDVEGDYYLRINVKEAEKAIETLGEYGYMIFKYLSIAFSYNWKITAT